MSSTKLFGLVIGLILVISLVVGCGGASAITPTEAEILAAILTPVPPTMTNTPEPPTTTPTPIPSTAMPVSSFTLGEITRSGMITKDEMWSGIVHITGDVIVMPGVTLTILPGTKVIFAAHQDDQQSGVAVPVNPLDTNDWIIRNNDPTWTLEYAQTHITLNVYGKLSARGNPDNWITFTSDSSMPDGGDWSHFQVNVGSIVEYCIIEYSRGGLDIAENTGTSVLVSHNIMRHNLWTGLAIHSSSPTVTYNEIIASGGHQGIDILGEGSAPIIAYNSLRDNKVGIIIQPGSTPFIVNNTLVDNDNGILVINSTGAVIRNNMITAPNGAHDGWSYMNQPIYPANTQMGDYGEVTCITLINSSALLMSNQLTQCPKGIHIEGNSSPEIRRNSIVGSINNGLFFSESFTGSPLIRDNKIYDQSCSTCSMSMRPIDVFGNWWGTIDVERIAQTVRSQGSINDEPFLEQPVELP